VTGSTADPKSQILTVAGDWSLLTIKLPGFRSRCTYHAVMYMQWCVCSGVYAGVYRYGVSCSGVYAVVYRYGCIDMVVCLGRLEEGV
jgi:hypothetical protein